MGDYEDRMLKLFNANLGVLFRGLCLGGGGGV